jgi:hypothetical protein
MMPDRSRFAEPAMAAAELDNRVTGNWVMGPFPNYPISQFPNYPILTSHDMLTT